MTLSHLRHKGGFNDMMDARSCMYALESTLQSGIIAASRNGNVKIRDYTGKEASSSVLVKQLGEEKQQNNNITQMTNRIPFHVLQILQKPITGTECYFKIHNISVPNNEYTHIFIL